MSFHPKQFDTFFREIKVEFLDKKNEDFEWCLRERNINFDDYFFLISGAVLSLVLFKRKAWPLVFGTGSGFGMAYSNCEHQFNALKK